MRTIYLEVVAQGAAGYLRAHAEALESMGYPLMADGCLRQAEKLEKELELRRPLDADATEVRNAEAA